MRITIDGKELKNAVNKLKPFMMKRPALVCYECVWIEASSDPEAKRVTIGATNGLEEMLNLFVPAKIDVPGQVCIDLTKITIPSGEVTIDADDGIATITTTTGTMSVSCADWLNEGMNVGHYFEDETINQIVFTNHDICSAISEVAYATEENNSLKMARSVTIALQNEWVTFSALDGLRLAVTERPALHVKPDDKFCVRVPGSSLMKWVKTAPYGAVAVVEKEKSVAFVADDGIAIFKKDDTPPFDWAKCMPRESVSRALVSKKQIINFAKEHEKALATKTGAKPIILSINDDEIAAEAIGASVKAKTTFHAMTEGEGNKFGVNPRYLREALEHLPVDDVVFCVIDKYKPIIICNPEYNEGFALVMPMKID